MERKFGAEIVRTFGARLRHIYETNDLGLTDQMVICLEKLASAEEHQEGPVRIQAQAGKDSSAGQQNGFSARFPLPTT